MRSTSAASPTTRPSTTLQSVQRLQIAWHPAPTPYGWLTPTTQCGQRISALFRQGLSSKRVVTESVTVREIFVRPTECFSLRGDLPSWVTPHHPNSGGIAQGRASKNESGRTTNFLRQE